MKYEIKNRWTGAVIFEAEIECSADTTEGIKLGLAVKAAVKARACLADANLADANLAGANLAGADLVGANLAGACLADACLADACLVGANLADANLARANLAGADLVGACLARGVKAYGYTFTAPPIQLYDRYRIEIWQGFMKIGCEKHTLAEWEKFTQKRIIEMGGKAAADWWKKWKPALFALAQAGDRMELPEQEKAEAA